MSFDACKIPLFWLVVAKLIFVLQSSLALLSPISDWANHFLRTTDACGSNLFAIPYAGAASPAPSAAGSPPAFSKFSTCVLIWLTIAPPRLFELSDFIPLPCAHPNCHSLAYLYRSPHGAVPLTRIID